MTVTLKGGIRNTESRQIQKSHRLEPRGPDE